jgi:hypothetical protein
MCAVCFGSVFFWSAPDGVEAQCCIALFEEARASEASAALGKLLFAAVLGDDQGIRSEDFSRTAGSRRKGVW